MSMLAIFSVQNVFSSSSLSPSQSITVINVVDHFGQTVQIFLLVVIQILISRFGHRNVNMHALSC